MKNLRFEGHSDDTFGEYGLTNEDFGNCATGTPFVCRIVSDSGEGLHVWGQYAGKDWPNKAPGCWMVGIQQLDEDRPIPNWPMRFTSGGYTVELHIEAPDDVTLEWISEKK